MTGETDDARGIANRGLGAPPSAALPPQPQYHSTVIGHRRPTAPPPTSSGETWISDVERGLAVRSVHFITIPRVQTGGKRKKGRRQGAERGPPGWSAERATQNATNALDSARKIVPMLVPLVRAVKAHGVDAPTSLLIGWISQESSGRPYFVQPGKLDEVGLFQISHAERVDYLGSTEPGGRNDVRAKMLDQRQDRGRQAQYGYAAQLMAAYQRMLDRAGLPSTAPAMPQMIRFGHNLGIPKAVRLVQAIAAAKEGEGLDLSTASWDAIVRWAAGHGKTKGFVAAMRASDYAILGGQQVLDTQPDTAP